MEPQNVWVFQASRKLTDAEVESIKASAKTFLSQWNAHGKSVNASYEILHHLFLIVEVLPGSELPSGCAIDALVHFIQTTEQQFPSLTFFDRTRLAYRTEAEVQDCSLDTFRTLYKEGAITSDTYVFNTLVTTRGAYHTDWERPLHESWHKQLV